MERATAWARKGGVGSPNGRRAPSSVSLQATTSLFNHWESPLASGLLSQRSAKGIGGQDEAQHRISVK